MLAGIIAVIALWHSPGVATPAAVASPDAVNVGQSFTVRIQSAPPGIRARWRVNTRARFLRSDSFRNEATFEAIADGDALITATLGAEEVSIVVRIGPPPQTPAQSPARTRAAMQPPEPTQPAPHPPPAEPAPRDLSNETFDALLQAETSLERQCAERPNPAGTRSMATLRAEIAGRFAREGKPDRAVEYLGASLFLDGGDPARWERLGDLAELVMEPALTGTIQTAYENALLLDPGRENARIKLIGSYLGSRNFEDAIPHLEYLVSRNDDDPPDWLHIALLATAYVAIERADAGRQYFSDRAKESGDNRFVVACAMLEHASGETPIALQLLAHVARSEPPGSAMATYAERLREMTESAPGGGAR